MKYLKVGKNTFSCCSLCYSNFKMYVKFHINFIYKLLK